MCLFGGVIMTTGKFTFTDNQWYNFICGFHAGLKLKDLNAPMFDSNTILSPIGVGGMGGIGLSLPTLHYEEGKSSYLFPVSTHDVDISYSGFTASIRFDTSELRFIGVKPGDYGSIAPMTSTAQTADVMYQYVNGHLHAVGMKAAPFELTEPCILFYLELGLVSLPTKNRPFSVSFDSGNYADMNQTTLLKWVETSTGSGVFNSYFITPLHNISGGIDSEIENKAPEREELPSPENPVLVPEGTPGFKNENFIKAGYAWVQTYTLSNLPDPPRYKFDVPLLAGSFADSGGIAFDHIQAEFELSMLTGDISSLTITPCNGFTVSYSLTEDPSGGTGGSGVYKIQVAASRNQASFGAVTFAYLTFDYDPTYIAVNPFNDRWPIITRDGILSNSSSSISTGGEGAIIVDWTPGGPYPCPVENEAGAAGGGGVYSDSEQTIIVSIGDIDIPIRLYPGWNDVQFWIPVFFIPGVPIDIKLEIEAFGYVLIPAGFTWNLFFPEGAVDDPSNTTHKMNDSLKFVDVYQIELIVAPEPVNLDDIIDDLLFEDISSEDIQEIKIKLQGLSDDLSFDDFGLVDFEVPIIPVDIGGNIDEIEITDEIKTELVNVDIIPSNTQDDCLFEDISDIEI